MLSKRLGILVVLAVLPALAQVPTSPVTLAPGEQIAPFQHAPMKLHGVPRTPGAVESENWSGYAVTGSDFTNAQGSWEVTKVDCTKTPNAYAAFWVGIDGYSSDTVEQTGTLAYCNGTTPVYYAWYEFYPAASVEIPVPVHPGQKISASVTYNGTEFTTTLTNETTGKTYSKNGTVPTATRSSAEWIAEAPCCTTTGGILPLADYGVGPFGEDFTKVNDTNYATDSTITGPISDFGTAVDAITMVSSKGVTESVPSALSTDGTSFKMTWKAE
jgi:hypothetical protein